MKHTRFNFDEEEEEINDDNGSSKDNTAATTTASKCTDTDVAILLSSFLSSAGRDDDGSVDTPMLNTYRNHPNVESVGEQLALSSSSCPIVGDVDAITSRSLTIEPLKSSNQDNDANVKKNTETQPLFRFDSDKSGTVESDGTMQCQACFRHVKSAMVSDNQRRKMRSKRRCKGCVLNQTPLLEWTTEEDLFRQLSMKKDESEKSAAACKGSTSDVGKDDNKGKNTKNNTGMSTEIEKEEKTVDTASAIAALTLDLAATNSLDLPIVTGASSSLSKIEANNDAPQELLPRADSSTNNNDKGNHANDDAGVEKERDEKDENDERLYFSDGASIADVDNNRSDHNSDKNDKEEEHMYFSDGASLAVNEDEDISEKEEEEEKEMKMDDFDIIQRSHGNRHDRFLQDGAMDNDDNREDESELDEDEDDNNISLKDMKKRILGRDVQSSVDTPFSYHADDNDDDGEKEISDYLKKAVTATREKDNQGTTNMTATLPTSADIFALEKELSCVICHSILYQPVSLPCGHNFCQNCLNWWFDKTSKESETDGNVDDNRMLQSLLHPNRIPRKTNSPLLYGACPTCRRKVLIDNCSSSSSSSTCSFAINITLRTVISKLFPSHLIPRIEERKKARLKSYAGENNGSHSRGNEVLKPLNSEKFRFVRLSASGSRGDGDLLSLRHNVVLDATDQCMQLALALGRVDASDKRNNLDNIDHGTDELLWVKLLLLRMEEDEVEDNNSSIPLTMIDDSEDNSFIAEGGKYSSQLQVSIVVSATKTSNVQHTITKQEVLQCPIMGRIGSSCSLVVSLNQNDMKKKARQLITSLIDDTVNNDEGETIDNKSITKSIRFMHLETGVVLEMKLNTGEETLELVNQQDARRESSSHAIRYDGGDKRYDSDESDDEDAVLDQFEDDGFIVDDYNIHDDDEEEQDENDVCCVCGEEGDFIVCGSDYDIEGCGRSFHLQCVNRDVVPPGDWVCQRCQNRHVKKKLKEVAKRNKEKDGGKKRIKKKIAETDGKQMEDYGHDNNDAEEAKNNEGDEQAESDDNLSDKQTEKSDEKLSLENNDEDVSLVMVGIEGYEYPEEQEKQGNSKDDDGEGDDSNSELVEEESEDDDNNFQKYQSKRKRRIDDDDNDDDHDKPNVEIENDVKPANKPMTNLIVGTTKTLPLSPSNGEKMTTASNNKHNKKDDSNSNEISTTPLPLFKGRKRKCIMDDSDSDSEEDGSKDNNTENEERVMKCDTDVEDDEDTRNTSSSKTSSDSTNEQQTTLTNNNNDKPAAPLTTQKSKKRKKRIMDDSDDSCDEEDDGHDEENDSNNCTIISSSNTKNSEKQSAPINTHNGEADSIQRLEKIDTDDEPMSAEKPLHTPKSKKRKKLIMDGSNDSSGEEEKNDNSDDNTSITDNTNNNERKNAARNSKNEAATKPIQQLDNDNELILSTKSLITKKAMQQRTSIRNDSSGEENFGNDEEIDCNKGTSKGSSIAEINETKNGCDDDSKTVPEVDKVDSDGEAVSLRVTKSKNRHKRIMDDSDDTSSEEDI